MPCTRLLLTATMAVAMAALAAGCSSTSADVEEVRSTLQLQLCDYEAAHPPGAVNHANASGQLMLGDIADSDVGTLKYWVAVLATPRGDSVYTTSTGQCTTLIYNPSGVYYPIIVPCEQSAEVSMGGLYAISRFPVVEAGMQDQAVTLASVLALAACRERTSEFVRQVRNVVLDGEDLECEVRAHQICDYNTY